MVLLQKPHPFIFNRSSVIIPSIITFILILVFKPFEFAQFSFEKLILWSAILAFLVGSIVLLTVSVTKKLFKRDTEESWTVGKEITLILSTLAFIMLALFVIFNSISSSEDWKYIFELVVIRTVIISFFPILIMVLYEQNHYQRIKRREADKLNQELQKQHKHLTKTSNSDAQNTNRLLLTAENDKVALQIAPMSLYYVKSEGNYLEVFYMQNQEMRKQLIRNSLKALESQLPSSHFFRCHKRFIVNVFHILKIDGNARNLELTLENISESIPVSRDKSNELQQLFNSNP